MSNKIIEHENQTYMFDGKYTNKKDKELEVNLIKAIPLISFKNCHLVVEEMFKHLDSKTIDALVNEIEAQYRFKGK